MPSIKWEFYFQTWTITSSKYTNWTELAQSLIKALHRFSPNESKNLITEETPPIITCNRTPLSNNALIEIQDVHWSGKLYYFFSTERQFRIQLCDASNLYQHLVSLLIDLTNFMYFQNWNPLSMLFIFSPKSFRSVYFLKHTIQRELHKTNMEVMSWKPFSV